MKTVEQAAKENSDNPIIAAQGFKLTAYNSFIAGVEFAYRWIPTSEEYPPLATGELVLLKHKNGWVEVTQVNDYHDLKLINGEIATHWRRVEVG